MARKKLYTQSLWIIILQWIILTTGYAQNSSIPPSGNSKYYQLIDQLSHDLENARDTNRVKILLKLSWTYKETNPIKAVEYGERALLLSQELNYQIGTANALNYLGVIYNLQGNYQKALGSHLRSARMFKALGDKIGVARSYDRIGLTLKDNHDHEKAIEYYQKSLAIARNMGDSSRMASPQSNLAAIYRLQGKYNLALECYQNAIAIYRNLQDTTSMAIALSGIGDIHLDQADYLKALDFYEQALKLIQSQDNSFRRAGAYLNLAKTQKALGNLNDAEQLALRSLELAKSYSLRDEVQTASLLLSEIYVQKQAYNQAYEYHVLYENTKDSTYKERESRRLTELQEIFDSEKKRNRLELLKKEQIIQKGKTRQQQNYKNFAWLMVGLISVFTLVLYRSNRIRKQANMVLQEQNRRINAQNLEIARQKDDIENKNVELIKKNHLIERKNDSYQSILKQLKENNLRLTESIRYAEKIQRAFLPYNHQFKESFQDYFVIFKPKDVVSGDFYWMTQVNGKIFVAVVDCTGHGVPGALMSMIGNTLLNEIINQEKIFNTNEILEQLHMGVRWSLKQNDSKNVDGMDLSLCRVEALDAENFEVQFSGAKSAIYYHTQGELHQLRGDRKRIGGWQKERKRTFTQQTFQLVKGDTLYFATDGFTDAPNAQRKKFGYKKLQNLLVEHQDLNMKEQGAVLLKALYEHRSRSEQRDDITMLGLRI